MTSRTRSRTVLKGEPADWQALPGRDAARCIRQLLHRCLERDQKRAPARLIADARLEIEEATDGAR